MDGAMKEHWEVEGLVQCTSIVIRFVDCCGILESRVRTDLVIDTATRLLWCSISNKIDLVLSLGASHLVTRLARHSPGVITPSMLSTF